ncbi:MAG: recombinase family protein [Candidatus Limnocylindrales bacterium]|jgi:DNA invertase Pin-like site-specific DNA recombinase
MTARIAAAYIRESEADETTDKEGQLIDCRTVAAREKIDPAGLVIFDDWNRSGSESAVRPAQERLLAEVKAGNVALIAARSIDRLMRSTVRMAEFYRLCDQHDTRIVTLREGEMREDNPSQWIARQSIMTAAEYESRVAKVRARAAVATKKRRGIPIGRPLYGSQPGESVDAVIRAFEDAGSFLGTCKLLNERGMKPRIGRWNVRTVARIIRRERPDLVPLHPRQGARTRATRIFSSLLVCGCGDTLTSMPRAGSVGYYCRRAHSNMAHPRPYVVSERKLLPWAREEIAHFRPVDENGEPFDSVLMGEASARERAALDARRANIIDMREAGQIDRAETDRRLAAVTDALVAVAAQERVAAVPSIDWAGPVADVNEGLRSLLVRIELDANLLPIRAEWRVPRFRRP